VPFKTIAGKKKDSEYKGIPVLVVNGRQINDSYIIVKTLSPILTGAEMTKEELEVDDLATFGLMPALEAGVIDCGADMRRCASTIGGFFGGCMCFLSLCFPCCGVSRRIKKEYPGIKELEFYGEQLSARLGENPYFHGASVGIVDIALYGMVAPFARAGVHAFTVRTLGKRPNLQAWMERIQKSLPLDLIFKC